MIIWAKRAFAVDPLLPLKEEEFKAFKNLRKCWKVHFKVDGKPSAATKGRRGEQRSWTWRCDRLC